MMNIGILTFYNANNYGAVLQAFALYNKLREMGHDVDMIDYVCPAISAAQSNSIRKQKGVRAKIRTMIKNVLFHGRIERFLSFRACLRKSKVYRPNTIAQADGHYDLFITGSDQVFNFALTGHDETFFLNFVTEKDKKVAYAASMGNFIDTEKETYTKLLKDFHLLSVREKSTAMQIKDKLGIACEVVPDPVFLYTAEQWKELVGLHLDSRNEPYVLIYTLFESPEVYRLAKEYAERNYCKVVAVTKALRTGGKADEFVRDAGPKEFLSLIINAAYVVTDSFHGTAFSIIFGKQLKIVMPPNVQNRIVDLLNELGIGRDFSSIDYTQVNKKLDVYRNRGIDFLRKI